MVRLAQPLRRQGFNVLLFDARNPGASDVDTFSSVPRFAEDPGAALRWLRNRHPARAKQITVVGHSVGAGAALFEATRNPQIDAVIRIGTFADSAQLTERCLSFHVPRLLVALTKRYVEWVIGYRFATIAPVNSIRQLNCPVLLVHGAQDATVPFEDGRQIFVAADPTHVRFLPIAGAGHDAVDKIEAHASELFDFIGCLQGVSAGAPALVVPSVKRRAVGSMLPCDVGLGHPRTAGAGIEHVTLQPEPVETIMAFPR